MRMKHDPIISGKRKPLNLTIDSGVIAAAREAGVNLSQVSEAALREATRQEQARRWQEENREMIEANNRWVEEHGLPLDKYRLF